MKVAASLLIFLFISCGSFAQTVTATSVPSAVKSKFESQYSGTAAVTWKKEGKNYCAWFEADNTQWMYLYGANGAELATGKSVANTSLPQPARDYFSWNLPGKKIQSSLFVNDAKGEQRFEVTSDDGTYIFDRMGHFIRKKK